MTGASALARACVSPPQHPAKKRDAGRTERIAITALGAKVKK